MSQQVPQDLKALSREKIGSVELSAAQLQALKQKVQPVPRPTRRFTRLQGLAVFLFLIGFGLLSHSQWQRYQREQLIAAVADEVVVNHLKQRPMEFQANALGDLDQAFTELDFTLVNSIQFPQLSSQLLGGRYCSIQGHTAAQLRLDLAGTSGTLYQVPFDSHTFARLGDINVDRQPLLRFARGLQVTLWEEKGVLLALVQAPDSDRAGSTLHIKAPLIPTPEQ
jgi:hypothetical protein